jgi:hypothetical protein
MLLVHCLGEEELQWLVKTVMKIIDGVTDLDQADRSQTSLA